MLAQERSAFLYGGMYLLTNKLKKRNRKEKKTLSLGISHVSRSCWNRVANTVPKWLASSSRTLGSSSSTPKTLAGSRSFFLVQIYLSPRFLYRGSESQKQHHGHLTCAGNEYLGIDQGQLWELNPICFPPESEIDINQHSSLWLIYHWRVL